MIEELLKHRKLVKIMAIYGTAFVAAGAIVGTIAHDMAMKAGWGYPYDYLVGLPFLFIIVLAPSVFVFYIYVLKPVLLIIRHNEESAMGNLEAALIPEEEIAPSEIGDIMRTRNSMLGMIFSLQSRAEQEMRELEQINSSLSDYLHDNIVRGTGKILELICDRLGVKRSGWAVFFENGKDPELLTGIGEQLHHIAGTTCLKNCGKCIEESRSGSFMFEKIRSRKCLELKAASIDRNVLMIPSYDEDIKRGILLSIPVPEGFTLESDQFRFLENAVWLIKIAVSHKKRLEDLKTLNNTLEQKVEQRTNELTKLNDFLNNANKINDYVSLAVLVPELLHSNTSCDIACLFLMIGDMPVAFVASSTPLSKGTEEELKRLIAGQLSSLLPGAASREGEIDFNLVLNRVEPRNRNGHAITTIGATEIEEVKGNEGKEGAIILCNENTLPFSKDEKRFLSITAQHISLSIERIKLMTYSEQRGMERVIQYLPEGIILLDSSMWMFPANEHASNYMRIIGASTDPTGRLREIAGIPVDELIAAGLAPPHKEVKLSKNGRHMVFELMGCKIGVGGSSTWHMIIIRDVTEAKTIMEQANSQQRLASVGQLAAGIAHDFNNTLQGILGYSDLIRRKKDSSETVRQYASNIKQNGEHAANLVKQILDFSRQSISAKRTVNLLPFIKEIIKLMECTMPEDIRFTTAIDNKGDYTINGDPVQVRQIITNLIINARDALEGRNDGSIDVRLSNLHVNPGDKHPSADLSDGKWVTISVKDNGPGIPDDIADRIFEPFFTTRGQKKGTGLGLAQVYGLVKGHKGAISVETAPETGALFTVYLPIIAKREEAREEPVELWEEEKYQTSISRGTVLLVDDSPSVLDSTKRMLNVLGYKVITAENGKQAMDRYINSKEEISLVLSDITMPEMSGLELYDLLSPDSSVRVILTSGYPLGPDAQKDLTDKNIELLTKPVGMNELHRVLTMPGSETS